MIEGHGDDLHKYPHIQVNFSSNVCHVLDHTPLIEHLYASMSKIRSYAEPIPYSLHELLAANKQIHSKEILVTNGAVESIYLIAQAFQHKYTYILQPTFAEYADACRVNNIIPRSIFSLDDLPRDAEVFWLCNPNNPTGEVQDAERLYRLIQERKQTLFIIDQSYEYFTLKETLTTDNCVKFPNVILIHSMTKRFAIPGLRLGYITANKNLIKQLLYFKTPWSVNALAIEAGKYLITHQEKFVYDLSHYLSERERVCKELADTRLIDIWESDTHYFLGRLRIGKAYALKEYLATEYGLLIRDASNFEGLDAGAFRIAVQESSDNTLLVNAIKKWITIG